MGGRRHTRHRGARSPGRVPLVLRALLGLLVALAVAFGAGGAAAAAGAASAGARAAVTAAPGSAQLESGRAARAAQAQPSKAARASADGDAPGLALPVAAASRRASTRWAVLEIAGPPTAWERPSYPTRDRARLMVFTN